MSDFDSNPVDKLDRWLADQRHELIVDLAATLDVEAGLGEVLIHPRHAALVADLDRSLDIEAGLAAIVTAEQLKSAPPATSRRPASLLAKRVRPVFNRAGIALNTRRVRDRVIAAVVVVIAFVVLTITTMTTAAPALAVLDYGVEQSNVGTCDPNAPVRFALTVRASGSGTVDYIWEPDEGLSSQPLRKTMTFTGAEQTMQDFYIVPRSDGQHLQGGVTVVINAQGSYLGASKDNVTCDGSGGNRDGTIAGDAHSPVSGSNGGL